MNEAATKRDEATAPRDQIGTEKDQTGTENVVIIDCINCARPIDPDAKFCPYCRVAQAIPSGKAVPTPESEPAATPDPPREEASSAPSSNAAPVEAPIPPGSDPRGDRDADIILRASSHVWDQTEAEDSPKPGQRRPLLVLDEQTIHLSHTDKTLVPSRLLERVEHIVAMTAVPVDVVLSETRWQSDSTEVRPRIVASLKDHLYSDYKMVFGVDYMGQWASIQMCLTVEPPILPLPPPPPKEPFYPPDSSTDQPLASIICYGLAAFCIVGMMKYPVLVIGTLGFPCYGYFLYDNKNQRERQAHQEKIAQIRKGHEQSLQQHREKVIRERAEVESLAQLKNLFRTYKIDDMRLFASAMNVVFQAVVDDIVKNDGAQVERVEGGKGGFLTSKGVTRISVAPRTSDATDVGL